MRGSFVFLAYYSFVVYSIHSKASSHHFIVKRSLVGRFKGEKQSGQKSTADKEYFPKNDGGCNGFIGRDNPE